MPRGKEGSCMADWGEERCLGLCSCVLSHLGSCRSNSCCSNLSCCKRGSETERCLEILGIKLVILPSSVLHLHHLSQEMASEMLLYCLVPLSLHDCSGGCGCHEGQRAGGSCGSGTITLTTWGVWWFSSLEALQTWAGCKDTRQMPFYFSSVCMKDIQISKVLGNLGRN